MTTPRYTLTILQFGADDIVKERTSLRAAFDAWLAWSSENPGCHEWTIRDPQGMIVQHGDHWGVKEAMITLPRAIW